MPARSCPPILRVDGRNQFRIFASDRQRRRDGRPQAQVSEAQPDVDWKVGGGWHTLVSVRRTVAQLDFYDFISVADLSAQRVNGGNAGLEPQRAWEFRASIDHPLLGDGLFKLDLGHDQVSLLQDRILICDPDHPLECFDAPGNIGTGRRDFVQLTLDLPLSNLWNGFASKPAARSNERVLTIRSTAAPASGAVSSPPGNGMSDVRRDFGKWSYGFSVSDNQRFTFYRTDEFDTNFNGAAILDRVRRIPPVDEHGGHPGHRQCFRNERRPRQAALLSRPRPSRLHDP